MTGHLGRSKRASRNQLCCQRLLGAQHLAADGATTSGDQLRWRGLLRRARVFQGISCVRNTIAEQRPWFALLTPICASAITFAIASSASIAASSPLLLRFSLHRRRCWVLHLDPVRAFCRARLVARAQPLAHDPVGGALR
jgi:hypothetical protein